MSWIWTAAEPRRRIPMPNPAAESISDIGEAGVVFGAPAPVACVRLPCYHGPRMGDELDDDADIRATLGDGCGGDSLVREMVRASVAGKLFRAFAPGDVRALSATPSRGRGRDRGRLGCLGSRSRTDASRSRCSSRPWRFAPRSHARRGSGAREAVRSERRADLRYWVIGDQVYLVMEWVHGQTLREYCAEPRSVREIVDVYRQAGQGLVAAHGCADRPPRLQARQCDRRRGWSGPRTRFRTIGDRGRVVCAARYGTPPYRAPEQARGPRPRSPPISLPSRCHSARRWRCAVRVPRWLAAITAARQCRGPGCHGFASLTQLSAPARPRSSEDPHGAASPRPSPWESRSRRFAIGRVENASSPCTGSEDAIAAAWNPGARARLVEHLRELGPFGVATADALAVDLDSRTASGRARSSRSCIAPNTASWTNELYERRLACLSRSRAALGRCVELLRTIPLDELNNVIAAARSEQRPQSCEARAL